MLLTVLIAATAHGQPAPGAGTKALRDAEGILLPDGAVARLGSSRFRSDGFSGSVTFSPNGELVVVGGVRSVFVFETATGRERYRFPIPDEHSFQIARFLKDGVRVAVATTAGTSAEVVTYSLADGKPLATAKIPGGNPVHIADITPDGSRVLARDWLSRAYLWDIEKGREVWEFAHTRSDHARPFTADGKHFALAGSQKAELYDAETGKVVAPYPDPGPRFTNRYAIGMSPDGLLAIAADKGDAVVILAARGTNRLRRLPSAHLSGFFVFSPDARYLVAPDPRGTQVWDLTAPDDKGPIARLPGARTAGFSADGKTLALADDGATTLRTVGDWTPLPQSADPPSPVFRVRFSTDGKQVIGYTRQGWASWPAAGGPATRISDDSPVHAEGLADVAANARTAVDLLHEPGPEQNHGALSGKYTVRVTDLTTGKDVRFPLGGYTWEPVQISPDGRHVAASLRGSEFVIWDAGTGAVLHRRQAQAGSTLFGAMPTPDGKGIARSVIGVFNTHGGPPDGPAYASVTVTDHQSGREWKMDPIPWAIPGGGARFSPDGSRMIVVGRWSADSNKNWVTVWDVRTGRRQVKWEREFGPVESVSLSTDGRSLLVGDRRGKLALIEVATGRPRTGLQHGGEVLSVAFHPNGSMAIASSPEAPVYVWDLIGSPGKWDPGMADTLWADLAGDEAKAAFAAIRRLRANPADAVAFLKDHVKPPAPPADEVVAALLRRLDGPRFADREKAQKELTEIAEMVRARLEAARKTATEEAGRRLDAVLKSADGLSPERLRAVRACEVLEGIRTPDAIAVLREWARGPEGARLTREAKESLARLK